VYNVKDNFKGFIKVAARSRDLTNPFSGGLFQTRAVIRGSRSFLQDL